jgi:hypothetical protein
MSGEDFLSRWSRRKLEAREEAVRQESLSEPRAPAQPVPAIEPADAAAPRDELTPEEIAALPKIEELTAETDITLFLRKGVPEALKNAALRRMWSLDPGIRDYVGDARDYAYDWNVPGGVPGNGPLLPSDDVGEMLRSIFPDEPARAQASAKETPGESPSPAGLSQDGEPDAHHPGSAIAARGDAPAPDAQESVQALAHDAVRLPGSEPMGLRPDAAVPSQPARELQASSARRHGRAKPV